MLKIGRSHDRLIFNMGIPIPRKDGLYIKMGPFLKSVFSWCCWWPSQEICQDICNYQDDLKSVTLFQESTAQQCSRPPQKSWKIYIYWNVSASHCAFQYSVESMPWNGLSVGYNRLQYRISSATSQKRLLHNEVVGEEYWLHSVRPPARSSVRLSVRLSVCLSVCPSLCPSRILCLLCSTYSSGWIHFICIHLIKQVQMVCGVLTFLQNLKIWMFGNFFKFVSCFDLGSDVNH